MAEIVYAVPGKEIQDAPAFCREEFGSPAACVAYVHLQKLEQPGPVRIEGIRILVFGASFSPGRDNSSVQGRSSEHRCEHLFVSEAVCGTHHRMAQVPKRTINLKTAN